jgi:hypothetical protein
LRSRPDDLVLLKSICKLQGKSGIKQRWINLKAFPFPVWNQGSQKANFLHAFWAEGIHMNKPFGVCLLPVLPVVIFSVAHHNKRKRSVANKGIESATIAAKRRVSGLSAARLKFLKK